MQGCVIVFVFIIINVPPLIPGWYSVIIQSRGWANMLVTAVDENTSYRLEAWLIRGK